MNIAPEHLSEEVRQLCERWPDTRVIGIRATQWQGGGSIVIDDVTFRVSWCASALSVAEELAALGDGERLILLTPLEDADLGLDVLARLARRRLIRPERWQMVRDAYGVRSVDPRLPAYAWMADALLAARPGKRTTPANALDAATAWRYVLGHFLDLPDGSPDADTILRWSMEPGAAERFAALSEPLADAVRQRWERTAGGLGALLARGIAAGHANDLLAMGLACDTLFGEEEPDSEAAPSVSALVEPALAQAAARLEPRLGGAAVEPRDGRAWGAAARRIVRTVPRDRHGEWLGRAESLLASLKAEDFAWRSTMLPSGFRQRLGHFATQATAAIGNQSAIGDPSAFASAEEAFRRVRAHIACEDDQERIRRLEMALRLVRALHARLRQPPWTRRDAARVRPTWRHAMSGRAPSRTGHGVICWGETRTSRSGRCSVRSIAPCGRIARP